jgi:transcriptional regulator GlxA family with amidase domain
MHIALALTQESLLSTTASVYDLVEFCRRSQLPQSKGAGHVYAVTSSDADGQFSFLRHEPLNSLNVPDLVLVLPLKIKQPWMPETYRLLVRWIRRSYDHGAVVASIGTGVFLLAEAGLFEGEDTTVSVLATVRDDFARCYPAIKQSVQPWSHGERLLVSGDLAWQELALHVLTQQWGRKVARLAAETFAIPWYERIEAPESVQDMGVDRVIARAQHWLSQHYNEQDLVGRCADLVGLSKRTFNRRFKEATGTTPIDFVQGARIRVSRNMLLHTDLRVEDISYAVGYEDIASFRKMFSRRNGMPPGEFRRRMAQPALRETGLSLQR